jgi:glycosyltransferase involved in cell wall biosynthesis
VCVVSTVAFALKWFMAPHINVLKERHDVTIVTGGSAADLNGIIGPHVSFIPVRIERKISPVRDVAALAALWQVFRSGRFDVVHSIMPKSGLLSMIAARAAAVPVRLHTFTGQVWANKSGPGRAVLKSLDRVLVTHATGVLADSRSQQKFLIDNGVVRAEQVSVLADGSIVGVNIARFAFDVSARDRVRQTLAIPADAIVFLFVGRLRREKGVLDLLGAFERVAASRESIHLLVVGPDEDGLDPAFARSGLACQSRVHRVGFTDVPEQYMSASDVLMLPSYREGFGTAIIEAAVAGLPAVASRIYGITDAVEEEVTGILHEPANIMEIAGAMQRLSDDPVLRRRMGDAARTRAVQKWPEERVTQALADFYTDAIARAGR